MIRWCGNSSSGRSSVSGVARHREARDALHLGRRPAVEEVEVVVGVEVRVERDPEQAVLVAAVDRDRGDPGHRVLGAVVALDRAAELDVVDVAVARDRDLHRVLGRVVERDLVERRVGRQALAVGPAVAGLGARRPLDGAADVVEVVGLGPVRALVPERGVEVAPAVVVRAPRDRVVVGGRRSVLLVVRVLVELEQDVDVLRLGGEVVPLVRPHPVGLREVLRGGVRRVDDVDRRLLELDRRSGVVEEPGAAVHLALPGPVAVGVGVGVDAHDAAAALRPALEGVALGAVEDALAVGVEEDDDLERAQAGVGEQRLVLAELDVEALGRPHLLDGGAAGGDRGLVAEAGGAGEDEDVVRLVGLDGDRAGHPAVEVAAERVDAGGVERVRDRGAARLTRLVLGPVGARRRDRVRQRRLVELPSHRRPGGHGDFSRLPRRVGGLDRRLSPARGGGRGERPHDDGQQRHPQLRRPRHVPLSPCSAIRNSHSAIR